MKWRISRKSKALCLQCLILDHFLAEDGEYVLELLKEEFDTMRIKYQAKMITSPLYHQFLTGQYFYLSDGIRPTTKFATQWLRLGSIVFNHNP